MVPYHVILSLSNMSGTDKIHKSMVIELDSVQLEAGPGGYTAGSVVYLDTNSLGVLALANTEDNGRKCVGIAEETKAQGQVGTVRITGTVVYSGWTLTPGDDVWASPSVAGGITNISTGSHVFLGKVLEPDRILLTVKPTSVKSTTATISLTAGETLVEGDWVWQDTADSKVKKIIATTPSDTQKVLGVVVSTGTVLLNQSVEILTFGLWNSTNTISGPIGDRWLSTSTPGQMVSVAPSVTQQVWLGLKLSDSKMLVRLGGSGGSGSGGPMLLTPQLIESDFTIPTGFNGLSAGDVTIQLGVTVTVPVGSDWIIIDPPV